MSLNLDLSDFLDLFWLHWGYTVYARYTTEMMIKLLTLITWLGWCLLDSCIVKLLFFPLWLISILGEILWVYKNPAFLSHVCLWAQLLPVDLACGHYYCDVAMASLCFCLLSYVCSWNSFIRKSCPFSSVYLIILKMYVSMYSGKLILSYRL